MLLFAGDDTHEAGEPARIADLAKARFGERIDAWIVLPARSVSPEAGPIERVLLDPIRPMHERYEVSDPAICVPCPDTFVGVRAPTRHADRVLAHLDGIFAGSPIL
jgi:hypothetical protein